MLAEVLVISGRGLGRKQKPLFEDFSIPLPPESTDGGGLTLRELITRIVVSEVEAFRDRQQLRRLGRVLSAGQIQEGIERGKVGVGDSLNQSVDTDLAVGTAIQGFEDGLYLVVIDETEQRDLDAQIYLRPGSRITFIRLVFLAGA